MDCKIDWWVWNHINVFVIVLLLIKEGLCKGSKKKILGLGIAFIIIEYLIFSEVGYWKAIEKEWEEYKKGELTLYDFIRRNVFLITP